MWCAEFISIFAPTLSDMAVSCHNSLSYHKARKADERPNDLITRNVPFVTGIVPQTCTHSRTFLQMKLKEWHGALLFLEL